MFSSWLLCLGQIDVCKTFCSPFIDSLKNYRLVLPATPLQEKNYSLMNVTYKWQEFP